MQLIKVTRQLLSPQMRTAFFPVSNALYHGPETNHLIPSSWAIGGVRHKVRQPKFDYPPKEDDHVIKYHNFNFYPRFPDHKDPSYEPTKLFAVRRVRTLKKRPYWEKRIVMGELGLADRRTVTITKNAPAMNAALYKVKHLIEITPITFPNGMPSESKHGFLKENGEFVIYDKLSPARIETIEDVKSDVEKLKKRDVDGHTLRRRLKLQWESRY